MAKYFMNGQWHDDRSAITPGVAKQNANFDPNYVGSTGPNPNDPTNAPGQAAAPATKEQITANGGIDPNAGGRTASEQLAWTQGQNTQNAATDKIRQAQGLGAAYAPVGTNAGQPAAGAGTTAAPKQTDWNAESQANWAAIQDAFSKSLGGQLQGVDQQTALNQRRNNEMSAMQGGSAGGGAAQAGQAQAQLGGMAMKTAAISNSYQNQIAARMSYLDMLQQRAQQAESEAHDSAEKAAARDAAQKAAFQKAQMDMYQQQMANDPTLSAAIMQQIQTLGQQ